jgi:hypothetical protein
LAGTLATTNGGTGLTSFTSGGVVYASSSSALATGSALTFDGANLGVGAATSYRLGVSGTNAGTNGLLQVGITGVTNGFTITTNASNNVVYSFLTGTQAQGLYQDASANVGIGTSSPVSQLTIYSSSGTASGQYNSPSTITLWNGSTAGDIGGTIAFAGSILSTTAKSFFASISSSVYASDASGTTGRLIFSTKSTQAATTLTERMRISETGLVGIGTQSPGAQLHVVTNVSSSYGGIIYNNNATGQGLTIRAGSTSSQDAFNVQTYDGGLSLFTVQGGGNVGIGTSSPANRLQVTTNKGGTSAESYDLVRLGLTGTGAIGDSSNLVWFSGGYKTAGQIIGGFGTALPSILKTGTKALLGTPTKTSAAYAKAAEELGFKLSPSQVRGDIPVPAKGATGFAEENQTLANRLVSTTTGKVADEISPEFIRDRFKDLGKQFDNVYKGKIFNIDQPAINAIQQLANIQAMLPTNILRHLAHDVAVRVVDCQWHKGQPGLFDQHHEEVVEFGQLFRDEERDE